MAKLDKINYDGNNQNLILSIHGNATSKDHNINANKIIKKNSQNVLILIKRETEISRGRVRKLPGGLERVPKNAKQLVERDRNRCIEFCIHIHTYMYVRARARGRRGSRARAHGTF